MPGGKQGGPEKWPDSIRRNYKQTLSGGRGNTPAYARYGTATPRRISALGPKSDCRGYCSKNKRHDRLIAPAVPEECGHGWPLVALEQGEL
jgi:hypothetical protein